MGIDSIDIFDHSGMLTIYYQYSVGAHMCISLCACIYVYVYIYIHVFTLFVHLSIHLCECGLLLKLDRPQLGWDGDRMRIAWWVRM